MSESAQDSGIRWCSIHLIRELPARGHYSLTVHSLFIHYSFTLQVPACTRAQRVQTQHRPFSTERTHYSLTIVSLFSIHPRSTHYWLKVALCGTSGRILVATSDAYISVALTIRSLLFHYSLTIGSRCGKRTRHTEPRPPES